MIVTRFAPSPTGQLHLGHAYSAVLGHACARESGGKFVLRIEDLDQTRARPRFVDGIFEDLSWLGLEWEEPVLVQSDRDGAYVEALNALRQQGLVYACFCTRADIAASVAAPQGPDGPLYPGSCRGVADPDLSRPHAWRLDAAKAVARSGPLSWTDHGETIEARPDLLGDVVLARKDAPASYHLAVTVDDAAQGVTDIVRGRDLFASTHVHRLLQAMLDLPVPAWHHHPLLTDADGHRLAKRHGAPTLADLRAGGMDPVALVAALRRGQMPAGYSLPQA